MSGLSNAEDLKKQWVNKYQGYDYGELLRIAKSYFVKKEGKKNNDYIGPKDEYQQWYYIINKEVKNAKCKAWRLSNIDREKARSHIQGNIARFKMKIFVLRLIGKEHHIKCCKCGIDDIRVLAVNHINGGGNKEGRERIAKLHSSIYNGERGVDDLDVRCFNCNVLQEYERGNRKLPANHEELYNKVYTRENVFSKNISLKYEQTTNNN